MRNSTHKSLVIVQPCGCPETLPLGGHDANVCDFVRNAAMNKRPKEYWYTWSSAEDYAKKRKEKMDEIAATALPIGAVVIYEDKENQQKAKLVIVQHSPPVKLDDDMLYMAAERPIAPPDCKYKLYSMGYLAYRLNAGWFVGNVDRCYFTDTGERVKVERFDVERYDPHP